jgi:hypothetical protein
MVDAWASALVRNTADGRNSKHKSAVEIGHTKALSQEVTARERITDTLGRYIRQG